MRVFQHSARIPLPPAASATSGSSRSPRSLRSRFPTVGIDFGGTNIKLGLVSFEGRVLASDVLPTQAFLNPQALIDGLHARTMALAAGLGVRRPTRFAGAGIGAPGLIDVRRGVVHQLVNVPGRWREVPLGPRLGARLGCRCVVDNDANVVALGEWRFGAGRGARDGVYVTLGTGVGGGLVVNDRLVRGASGSAGEIGHTIVRAGGAACACGGRGCLEAYLGTTALVRTAARLARSGRSPALARFVRHGDALSPSLISRAAAAGDPAARRVWQEFGRLLGLGLSSLVNALNPERIVIGGGIAKAWPWFIADTREALAEQAFAVSARAARIVRAALGSHAGIIGGAALVWEQQRES